jgi:ABC-type Fe3+ transport system substrate-binding protein
MATEPTFVQGHLGVLQWIVAGRKALTFDCSVHTGTDMKKAGQPLEVVFSASDPTPIFYNTAGILRAAPHPNAAKLYVNWVMSREQQISTGNWSARSDVPPPVGMKPLSGYTLASRYREFLTDTKLVEDLRARFLAFTGPPVNKTVNA